MKTYICLQCHKLFNSRKGCATRVPKFCSRKCSAIYNCSKPEVKNKMSQAKKGRTAYNKLPTGIRGCLACNKNITFSIGAHYQPKYCSRECRNNAYKDYDYSYLRGENSHFWKGGVTKDNEVLRKSAKYRNWRIKVFERDKYTCQNCGQIGGFLQADHINPFAYFPELRFDLDNGRTLCLNCHYQTDTYGSKAFKYISKIINEKATTNG